MGLNKVDNEYHTYLKDVLTNPDSTFRPAARTRASTVGGFNKRMVFDCSEYLPVSTTKRVPLKTLSAELVWFMQGRTDLKFLLDRNCHIWDGNAFDKYRKNSGKKWLKNLKTDTLEYDEAQGAYVAKVKEGGRFAQKHGDLGPVYGAQWRHFKTPGIKPAIQRLLGTGGETDQLANSINIIENNPFSRYALVDSWQPGEMRRMALPPCHMKYQWYVRFDQEGNKVLDLSMDQRSCDSLLGVPFNFTSEALKLYIVAAITGCQPGKLYHTLEDAHVYCGVGERADWYKDNYPRLRNMINSSHTPDQFKEVQQYILDNATPEPRGSQGADHVPYVLEQLARQESGTLPMVKVDPTASIDTIDLEHITIDSYKPQGIIKINDIKPRMAV